MEMTTRGLWTLVHGMGFGALYLLACSFAIVELYRRYKPLSLQPISTEDETFLGAWLVVMAVVAWITVLTGAYVIYPWYRAVPPAGMLRSVRFPQALLKSNPEHHRLACDRHGVERAHRLDCAHFDHDGRGGFSAVPTMSHQLSATARGGAVFVIVSFASAGDCGILRRGIEQACSG